MKSKRRDFLKFTGMAGSMRSAAWKVKVSSKENSKCSIMELRILEGQQAR